MPRTMRYRNHSEITHHANQPGKKKSSHSGAVTMYSTPAQSTVRMRQEKWLACQVPCASER